MRDAKGDWRFLGPVARPWRWHLAGAAALLTVDAALTLTQPLFAAGVTAAVVDARPLSAPLLLAWLGVVAIQAGLGFAHRVLAGSTSMHLQADLGDRVYDHLQALPLAWHHQRVRGEVLSLLTTDVWRLGAFLVGTLAPLLPLLLVCLGALVLMARIEPRIGLAVALGVPLLVLALKAATRSLRPLAEASLREDAVRVGIAQQNLAALPLIKAHRREGAESARFAAQGRTVRGLEVRQLRIASALAPATRVVAAAAVLGLVWFGGRGVAAGTLTADALVALLLYAWLLVQPVSQLASVYGQVQGARGAMHRLADLFREAPEPDSGTHALATVRGDIAFEAVGFAYPGRPPVFESLDLVIRAGETVAITGANGAGKSTLGHLLMRFADPQSGRVTLDGVDLRELALRDLRTHVGLVSQHVLLLNATIAENIAYGRFGATLGQVEQAARAAHAHGFIAGLPHGYDTVVGDDGALLSGGQKQRLALARALLKDPAVLVLDEATAMFDPEGERDFIAQCHELLRARTVLLITHRPASLALADRVLELRDGRVVQRHVEANRGERMS